jgi:hypothetical protein
LPVSGADAIIVNELLNTVTEKVEEVSRKSWKFTVRGKPIVVRDVLANVASKLETMKSIGDAISDSIPEAVLP